MLLALQRYYIDDVMFARVAREAGVSIGELIDFVGKNDLPIVYEEADVVEGIRKVSGLLEGRGGKSVLSMARATSAAMLTTTPTWFTRALTGSLSAMSPFTNLYLLICFNMLKICWIGTYRKLV